jgi:hypothetical protein
MVASSTALPYIHLPMESAGHAVLQTPIFQADAKAAGLSEEDVTEIVVWLSQNPLAGALIPGTGGARKVRFAGRGKGKSGGYRTIHYYGGDDVPLFLLALINKGERENISRAEANALRAELAALADDYRAGVARAQSGRSETRIGQVARQTKA